MTKTAPLRRRVNKLSGGSGGAPSGLTRTDLRLWVRLLACAHAAEQRVKVRIKDRFGINQTQFNLLSQLARTPGGIRMGELSRRTIVTGSNVTVVIDDLAMRGLVKRAAAPGDRRAIVIQLTAKGQAAFSRWAPEHAKWISATFKDLSLKRKNDLIAALDDLKEAMQATLSKSL